MTIRSLASIVLAVVFSGCRAAPSVSVEDSVAALVGGVNDHDGRALWHHLPRSMKAELADLLRAVRGRTPAPLAIAGDRLVAEAAEALSRQASRMPEFAPLRAGMKTPADRQAFADGLAQTLQQLAAGVLRPGDRTDEEIVDRAGPPLMKMLVPALRATGSPLLEPWQPGGHRLTPIAGGKVRCIRQAGDGKAVSEVLVQVDGRWIPERWVHAWRQVVAAGQALVHDGGADPLRTHTVQIIRLVNQTRARLHKLRQAGDQTAFDEALSLVAGSLSLALIWASTPMRG
jgi:hypothetical protein